MAQALRRTLFAASLTAVALCATPATACPRCLGASSRDSLFAYFATGAALSLLPLAIIGTVGLVIYRHNKKNSRHDSDSESQG